MTQAETYTVELSDLMEHEKVIEQGLATFREVGWALLAIRDGKKYRAAGFDTFEHYCLSRWHFTKQHAGRLMSAAEIVEVIESTSETEPMGSLPRSERQVRPLRALDDPAEQAEAWAEAVEDAGGAQPTAKQVEAAVNKRREPPKKEHPAPFSDPLLEAIADQLKAAGVEGTVLDPFAGTGRIHELRDRADVHTIGVEIEPEWAAKHADTIEGNALHLTDYVKPGSVDAIATSPTYGNRMADSHDAKDESVRLTYTHTLGRKLHDDNSGQMQWGDEYRAFHEQAWREAVAALKAGGTLTLNIKDHVRGGERQFVTSWHVRTLLGLGLELEDVDKVGTRGLMAGANADVRTCAEYVITFRKTA